MMRPRRLCVSAVFLMAGIGLRLAPAVRENVAFAVAQSSSAQRPVSGSASDLIGTWTLISAQRLDGASGPATIPSPRGMLVFDAAFMWTLHGGSKRRAKNQELRRMLPCAYYGSMTREPTRAMLLDAYCVNAAIPRCTLSSPHGLRRGTTAPLEKAACGFFP